MQQIHETNFIVAIRRLVLLVWYPKGGKVPCIMLRWHYKSVWHEYVIDRLPVRAFPVCDFYSRSKMGLEITYLQCLHSISQAIFAIVLQQWKQHSSGFLSPSSRKLETCTSGVQTASGPRTWESGERAACNHALLHAFSAACRGVLRFVPKDIVAFFFFTKAQEDGYSWHSRPLLSGKEMGTSHSKLPTEQESWIRWNLHFNSYSTQKCQEPLPYKMIHGKTREMRGRIQHVKRVWLWWKTGGWQKSHEETYHRSFFYCICWQFYTYSAKSAPSLISCYKRVKVQKKKPLHEHWWLNMWGQEHF